MYVDDVSFMDGHMIIHVVHVKGEGRYGEPRSVLLMDGVEDIVQHYLDVRASKLAERGKESRSMFPPLNNSNEFYTQQGFCRMKACVEKEIGVRFQLRAGRRAFGQRLLDSGNRIEDVSVAMGHSSTKTTEGYYARNSENQVIKRILRNQTNNRR
ncbi:MAG: site-specific integrase [Candidatus Methanomethylophilaceae archaeon]|nr:site-specific integrase [Candidatus Methanomethylophilaceae archaeon]